MFQKQISSTMSTTSSATVTNNKKEEHASPQTLASFPVEHDHEKDVPVEHQLTHLQRSMGCPPGAGASYRPANAVPFPRIDSFGMEQDAFPMSQQPGPHDWILQSLKGQVEFYFSYENLLRDDFMVNQLMFHGGTVPCLLVGSFPRVREILGGGSAPPQLLHEALQFSPLVRVYGAILVPVTDALQQALYVRRQNHCFRPQQQYDISSISRYSPTTTSITDDTTASSQATVPKETPVAFKPSGPKPDFEYSPRDAAITGAKTSSHVIAPVQPPVQNSSVEWAVESPQPQYAYVYNSYANNNNQNQVVPYGYTVTAPAVVSPPDAMTDLLGDNNLNGPSQHNYRRFKKKKSNFYRLKKRQARLESNQAQSNETNHNRGKSGSLEEHQEPKQDRKKHNNKKFNNNEQQLTKESNLDGANPPNNYHNKNNPRQHSDCHQSPLSANPKQTRKQRNHGKQNRGGNNKSNKTVSTWTNDDFPSLQKIPGDNQNDTLVAGLQGISLE